MENVFICTEKLSVINEDPHKPRGISDEIENTEQSAQAIWN